MNTAHTQHNINGTVFCTIKREMCMLKKNIGKMNKKLIEMSNYRAQKGGIKCKGQEMHLYIHFQIKDLTFIPCTALY